MKLRSFALILFGLLIPVPLIYGDTVVTVTGSIVDAAAQKSVPARLYIQSETGDWFHAKSASHSGTAIPYSKIRGNGSVEVHTTLSAGDFVAELPVGSYTLTAERGKEYIPISLKLSVREQKNRLQKIVLPLHRWTNMASRGWYSGETHVHRTVAELPTLMLAEDLNVTFPLTAWVTDSRDTPLRNNKNPDPVPFAELIKVDATHVIWPVNTEYEIFTVNGNRHTLGAVFVLNHREALRMATPPVTPIAEEARRQGGILELDKHNWPWSMMLVPVMKVGLFELTNNHIWRTGFQFRSWYPEYTGEYMNIDKVEGAFTERGWIDFGFKNYYALLNCGFDMKPTAGTASGVHPVPLGFGRVYIKIDGQFSYEKWLQGLMEGRSFVTTGPMLMVDYERAGNEVMVSGSFESGSELGPVEIVINGQVARIIANSSQPNSLGGRISSFKERVPLKDSSWIAVRGFEDRKDKRPRFAHTAPVYFEVTGRPLRPAKEEVEYLAKRVEGELIRHQGVLEENALNEYRQALAYYRSLPTP